MVSRGESKLDRLKRESNGAAKEVPTCAVPMHAPQTSSLSSSQGVGEVNSACEIESWRRVQPRLLSGEGKPRLLCLKQAQHGHGHDGNGGVSGRGTHLSWQSCFLFLLGA